MADDSNNTKNPVYAVLDVETTGLSRTRDRIVQIACLKIGKDGSQSTWMRYVNPCMDSEYLKEAFQIHHIPPEFLLKKTPFKDVAESFCDFLKDVDFLVAHNCLFDWDMLCREFQLLEGTRNKEESSKVEENVSKFWWKKFYSTNNWLDTLRLSMICFPKRNTYRLEAIKDMLNIEPQLQKTGALSTEGDFGGDEWKAHKHDAMYDVLTTYGVLQHCMESSFHDLVQDFPMAFLDTGLLLDMQQLLSRGTTGREDLVPFAKRSKEYFTISRPKGKKLGDLSKSFLQMVTISLKADPRSDERIILIYEAAILEPLDDQMMLAISSAMEDMKKEENRGNKKVVVEKDKEQDEQQKEEVKNREEEHKEKQRTAEKKEDKQRDQEQEEEEQGEVKKEKEQKVEQQKLEKKGEEQMDVDQNKIEKEKQTKEEQREVEKKWKEQREEEEQKVELENKGNACMEVEQNEKGKKEKQTKEDQKELEKENQMEVEKKEDEQKVEQQKLEKKIEEQVEVDENEMGKEEKQMKEEQEELEKKNEKEKQWEVENKREEQEEVKKQKHEQEEEEGEQKLENMGKELMEVEQNEIEKKEEEQEKEKEQNQSKDDEEEDLNCSAKKRPKLSLQ